jgi:hypothetical protein
MGQTTSLSNPVLMDVTGSHVGVYLRQEGLWKKLHYGRCGGGMVALPKDISKNLSIIMLDTMGIYWTMKYPTTRMRSFSRNGIWCQKGSMCRFTRLRAILRNSRRRASLLISRSQ